MAERMVMRQIREGEVPPDGGTVFDRDLLVFAMNGRTVAGESRVAGLGVGLG